MSDTPVQDRRAVISWCLFDFGNSSFTTVIITSVFNVHFVEKIATEGGTSLWSMGLVISNLLVILTAPLVGAIADYSGRKMLFLKASFVACIVATAALSFLGAGDVWPALVLLIVANTAFASGENLVAAFLPDLVSARDIPKVSAWGWGVGYVGGLVALFLCMGAIDVWGEEKGAGLSGIIVALFFLAGGLPTFVFVKEKVCFSLPLHEAVRRGLSEVVQTGRNASRLPDLFRFFAAALVLQVGIYGVIQFAGIYGAKLVGLDQSAIIKVLLFSQFTAFAGAMSSGWMAARLGGTRWIGVCCGLWLVAALLLLLKSDATGFWMAALLAGFAMGSSLATIRSTVALLTPRGRGGEIFGFWGVFGRFAAIIAPGGNVVLLWLSGGRLEAGIIFFACCFVAAYFLLLTVDEHRGHALARSTPPAGDAQPS